MKHLPLNRRMFRRLMKYFKNNVNTYSNTYINLNEYLYETSFASSIYQMYIYPSIMKYMMDETLEIFGIKIIDRFLTSWSIMHLSKHGNVYGLKYVYNYIKNKYSGILNIIKFRSIFNELFDYKSLEYAINYDQTETFKYLYNIGVKPKEYIIAISALKSRLDILVYLYSKSKFGFNERVMEFACNENKDADIVKFLHQCCGIEITEKVMSTAAFYGCRTEKYDIIYYFCRHFPDRMNRIFQHHEQNKHMY